MWRQVSLGLLAVAGVSCASASSTVPPPAAPTVALTPATAELPHDSVGDLPPHTPSTSRQRPEFTFNPPASDAPEGPAAATDLAKGAAVELVREAIATNSQAVDPIASRTDRQSATSALMVITIEVSDPTGEVRLVLVEVALSRRESDWSVEAIGLA